MRSKTAQNPLLARLRLDGDGEDAEPSALGSVSTLGSGGASPAFASACPTTVFTGLFLRGLCLGTSAVSRILALAGYSNSILVLAADSKFSQMAASLVAAVLAAADAGEVGRQNESLDGKGAMGAVATAATAASCGGFDSSVNQTISSTSRYKK